MLTRTKHRGAHQVLKMYLSLLLHMILALGAILVLIPFFWMISTSLKELPQVLVYPPRWIPKPVVFKNYVDAWNSSPFSRYFLNSIILSAAVTISHLVTSCLAAYAFARLKFWGKDLLFLLYLGTIMMPHHVTLIPAFVIVRILGWVNTYAGLIVPQMARAISVFLLRQFFLQIPRDLEDAAIIDGCGPLRILIMIFLPLSRPALATLSIFSFMTTWNEFLWPLIVTNSTNMRTVQVGLRYLLESEGFTPAWNKLMAAAIFVAAPVILFFIMAQKQFIKGITLSGLKG